MSKGSIYDKNWLELVFDGKNKEYGAYQLRQENERTTIMAFLSGIGFLAGIAGLGMAISSFNSTTVIDNPPIPDDPSLHVAKVFIEPKKDKPRVQKKVIPIKKEQPAIEVKSKDLLHPIIVKHDENPDDVTQNKNLKNHAPDTNTEGKEAGTGIIASPGTTGGTETKTDGTDTGKEKPGGIITTNMLDKMPEFPGGLKKFSEYIANNIEKPDSDSNASSINVIMTFVVEKDGSMTDIKVLRSSDKELEKAAIKVLKALRIKWTPGIKDGQYVRTQYIQSIRVNL